MADTFGMCPNPGCGGFLEKAFADRVACNECGYVMGEVVGMVAEDGLQMAEGDTDELRAKDFQGNADQSYADVVQNRVDVLQTMLEKVCKELHLTAKEMNSTLDLLQQILQVAFVKQALDRLQVKGAKKSIINLERSCRMITCVTLTLVNRVHRLGLTPKVIEEKSGVVPNTLMRDIQIACERSIRQQIPPFCVKQWLHRWLRRSPVREILGAAHTARSDGNVAAKRLRGDIGEVRVSETKLAQIEAMAVLLYETREEVNLSGRSMLHETHHMVATVYLACLYFDPFWNWNFKQREFQDCLANLVSTTTNAMETKVQELVRMLWLLYTSCSKNKDAVCDQIKISVLKFFSLGIFKLALESLEDLLATYRAKQMPSHVNKRKYIGVPVPVLPPPPKRSQSRTRATPSTQLTTRGTAQGEAVKRKSETAPSESPAPRRRKGSPPGQCSAESVKAKSQAAVRKGQTNLKPV